MIDQLLLLVSLALTVACFAGLTGCMPRPLTSPLVKLTYPSKRHIEPQLPQEILDALNIGLLVGHPEAPHLEVMIADLPSSVQQLTAPSGGGRHVERSRPAS